MADIAPFVVIGLVTGSLYGLAAAGLVLTYKTSGIFNFAHGAVGAAAAFAFHDLRDVVGFPSVLAAAVVCLLFAPVAGIALSFLAARLADASVVRRVVATVGTLLLIQGIITLRYGVAPLAFDSSLPTSTFEIVGVNVGYDQAITVAIALAGLVALELMFRRSRLGLQMRALVDDADLLDLTGAAPSRVRASAWIIGAVFASASGILLAPTVGLDALLLTMVVVQAFGAAAIGRFDDITTTFLGGLGIGVLASLFNAPTVVDRIPGLDRIQGLDQSVPFIVLFVVLLLLPGRSVTRHTTDVATHSDNATPRSAWIPLAGLAGAATVAAPLLAETKVPVFTLGAVFVIIFASLFLLVETSGQVSLCHAAFVAIGATTFSHLTAGAGLPWLVGVAGAALVAIPVGMFVAVPAIRLSGVFLALATFGFGILVERLLYSRGVMFGALGSRVGDRPALFGLDSDTGYFYLCALVAVGALATVSVVRRGHLGRFLEAMAGSPVAVVTHGASVSITKVLVFCISTAMAAVGGALYVGVVGSVSSSGASGSALVSFNSLVWLAVLAFVGRAPAVAPVAAAIALVVAPSYLTDPNTAQYLTIGFGVLALGSALVGNDLDRWMERGATARDRRTTSPVRQRLAEGTGHAG